MASLPVWLRLARIEHSVMVAVAVVSAEAVAAKSAGIAFNAFSFAAIFPALGPFFITAASFVINDFFGVRTDKANRRFDRPLVSGEVHQQPAPSVRSTLIVGLGPAYDLGFAEPFMHFAVHDVVPNDGLPHADEPIVPIRKPALVAERPPDQVHEVGVA